MQSTSNIRLSALRRRGAQISDSESEQEHFPFSQIAAEDQSVIMITSVKSIFDNAK